MKIYSLPDIGRPPHAMLKLKEVAKYLQMPLKFVRTLVDAKYGTPTLRSTKIRGTIFVKKEWIDRGFVQIDKKFGFEADYVLDLLEKLAQGEPVMSYKKESDEFVEMTPAELYEEYFYLFDCGHAKFWYEETFTEHHSTLMPLLEQGRPDPANGSGPGA